MIKRENKSSICCSDSPHSKCTQKGTTLIEVLITLVILAFGLLGIAALQLVSKRSNFEALQRTTAGALASDIIERMRANSGSLDTYVNIPLSASIELTGTTLPTEPTPVCTAADPCIPDATGATITLANHDLWEIEQTLIGATEQAADGTELGGLVTPTACITTTVPLALTDRSGPYTVTIVWRGQTKLSDPFPANTCGSASTKYDGDVVGDNAHRRMLVVNHFIDEN